LEVVSGGAISLICCVALTTGSVAILTAPGSVIAGSDSSDEAPVTMQAVAFTAGTGGLEASRPVGTWVRENTLSGSRFLTIGPSLANVIQFYGQRQALALSVSPNPLHRNPTYQPVLNPDLTVRTNAVQYLVYDAYTAQRTPYFAEQLLRLVHKYNGVLVYSYYTSVGPAGAASGRVPLVLIYEVHP
jgi:hypothetical protein